MRFYLYVSQTKVDQLFDQVPGKRLGKIAKKLTIDLKLLKAQFANQVGDPQYSLYAKLSIIERFLDESGSVLGVDEVEPDQGPLFFAGQMGLRWGRLIRRAGEPGSTGEPRKEEPSGVVYFFGRTSDTLLGMGGSARHIVGAAEGAQSMWQIGSAPHDLIDAMREDDVQWGQSLVHYQEEQLAIL